jgi:hypothetical protein
MKLQELNKLNKRDLLYQLHKITNGYDKYLVIDFLNEFYKEVYHKINSKYKDITDDNIDNTLFYINGFYFRHYNYENFEFIITNKLHLFDFGKNVNWHKQNPKINSCRNLFNSIHTLESIFADKHLNQIEKTNLCGLIEIQNNESTQSKDKIKASLTISEIALKYVYEGENITRENAKDFLLGTGHTSSEKLYQKYTFYSNNTDRKADPESKVKLNNKIKLFEKVIAELPENINGKAKDELQILYSFKPKYE